MLGSARQPVQRLPLNRFSAFADLTADETEALQKLAAEPILYKRGHILRREGDLRPSLFLLHKGWAANRMTLPGGGRQYFDIHCAGDLMGASSLALTRATDTLVTFTDATVSTFAPEQLSALFTTHPRLAMIFFLAAQTERTFLMDHLTALGRCSAEQRIAGFLVHISERTASANLYPGAAFELPLSQQQIGDVMGLTPVHVNRVLRGFDTSGHIRRYRRWIELLRLEDLRLISGLPRRDIARDLPWLAAA